MICSGTQPTDSAMENGPVLLERMVEDELEFHLWVTVRGGFPLGDREITVRIDGRESVRSARIRLVRGHP